MPYVSEVKTVNKNLLAMAQTWCEYLPAIPGKAYRIKSVNYAVYNEAASTGHLVQVMAWDINQNPAALGRAIIKPGVVDCVNQYVPINDFVTKPGTKVEINAYDVNIAACNFDKFKNVFVDLVYQEIDQ